jgi:hypothetical protein
MGYAGNSRLFLKGHGGSLLGICSVGLWGDGDIRDLATIKGQWRYGAHCSQEDYLPEAEEIFDFFLAGLM